jgi:uncharacterized coiled-coil protein SlyX
LRERLAETDKRIGELESRVADAAVVAELKAQIQELETRFIALRDERADKAARVVRLR